MLQKGLHLIEQQFPGYMQELSNAGALPVDHLTDMIFVRPKVTYSAEEELPAYGPDGVL